MLIQNISANVVTLAGQYTIAAGGDLNIPFQSLKNDTSFLSYLDNQSLIITQAEESFTLDDIPRFTQGTVFSNVTVLANTPYIPMTNNGTTPITLWLAPFQNSRLYLQVTAGDVEVTLIDSPDGGVTYYPIPDAPILSANINTNGGLTSIYLPKGLVLVKFTLNSQNGGTATLKYSRQT